MKNRRSNFAIGNILHNMIVFLAFFSSVFLIVSPKMSNAASNDATLLFDRVSLTVNTNTDFNLVARVNPGANTTQGINAVQLDVTFDPAVLQLSGVSAVSPFAILGSPNINNTTGNLSVTLFIGGSEITTTSNIATLAFHAKAIGNNSPISFASTSNAAVNDGVGSLVVNTRTVSNVTVTDSPIDSTAPVRSSGSPSGRISSGTKQTTISVVTDEAATCKYAFGPGVAYDSMVSIFENTGATSHSTIVKSLKDGKSYSYYIKCKDGANNSNVDDYLVSFTVKAPKNDSDKEKEVSKRYISNSKHKIKRGMILKQSGKRFSKKSPVSLYFSKPSGGYYQPQKIITTSNGKFLVRYRVTKPAGTYNWYAVDEATGKKSKIKYYIVK